MNKYYRFVLWLPGLCCLCFACSDDPTPIKKDGRVDGSSRDGLGQSDQRAKDLGTGDLTCAKVLDCQNSCTASDSTCLEGCLAQGTKAAQQFYQALDSCSAAAEKGACQSKCSGGMTLDCIVCIDNECLDELHYCFFGDTVPGFGDVCDSQTLCKTGFDCQKIVSTSQKGYCTMSCTGTDHCQGAPLRTFARCNRPDPAGGKFCGFVCKLPSQAGTTEYDCPSTMICSDIEVSTGSNVFLCKEPQ